MNAKFVFGIPNPTKIGCHTDLASDLRSEDAINLAVAAALASSSALMASATVERAQEAASAIFS